MNPVKECIQIRGSRQKEMSVKICTMLDSCNCGEPDCCSKDINKKDKGECKNNG